MTYMATHLHKNPCPGGHEIKNFIRPILCHHYFIFMLGVEKVFKEILHFHYTTKMATP